MQAPGLRRFSGNFLAFSEQWISRANVTTFSKLFDIFPLNFSIVHFYCLKPFAARLLLGKNFHLFENITLNMSVLLKTNLCGTSFSKFRQFWSIWWRWIHEKISFLCLLAKVDTSKEFFSNSFARINKRLVEHIIELNFRFTEFKFQIEIKLKLNWIQIYSILSLDLSQ